MAVDESTIRERIQASGLRATRPRIEVLRLLLDASSPVSHPEVTDRLAGFDRSTLYRNLVDLTEAGLLRRVDLGDHLWRYELAEHAHEEGVHPHFLCSVCGEVSCLPELALPDLPGLPRAVSAGQVTIQLEGVCDDCSESPAAR